MSRSAQPGAEGSNTVTALLGQHLVGRLEEATRMVEQLAIRGMIHRLNAGQAALELRRMLLDVAHELVLGRRRTGDQPFGRSRQRLDDAVEIVLAVVGVAGSDDACLLVDLM